MLNATPCQLPPESRLRESLPRMDYLDTSPSIALVWQSSWAMPLVPAGFEARSRDLASPADPISILQNPLTAAAMIVARLVPSIKIADTRDP